MERRLNKTDRERIVDLYESRYRKSGRDVTTVGWGSVRDQLMRFDVLFRGLELDGKSILDVGCGLGDIIPYLDSRTGGNYSYTGIDVTPAFVKDAEKTFIGSGRKFIVGDILEMDDIEKVDIVVLSGALNFRIEDNVGHAHSMVQRMFDLSNEVVSFNMLSSYVDFIDEKNFHHQPEEMYAFSKSISRWVNMYSDYPLYEFTIQIVHNPRQEKVSQ